jgi:xeroderma pigmentosum group C-complementing protein
MFERAMEQLTMWWANTFFEVIPEGHIRNHTYEEIQQKLEIRGLHIPSNNGLETPLDLESFQDITDDDEPEIIRSPKSLMKHALMQTGSRDISAQLFTALCRGLGIPARLVVSIQSVPWKVGIDGPKTSKTVMKGRVADIEHQSSDAGSSSGQRLDEDSPTPMSEKAKGKQKAKPVTLRKTKNKKRVLKMLNNSFGKWWP